MRKFINKIIALLKYGQIVKAWKKRHAKVFRLNPSLSQKALTADVKKHLDYWKIPGKKFNEDTFTICHNISGVTDRRIVPEELYQGYIEPKLNNTDISNFFSHKSFYHHWHGNSIFPACYAHKIDGDYFDDKFNLTTPSEIIDRLNAEGIDYVIKPNYESYGGKQVEFISEKNKNLTEIISGYKNFVIQEKIKQHPDIAAFHPESLNTIRVHLYRSVKSGEMVFLHAALRVGKDGSLDNLSDGGMVSFINQQGYLHGYALDKFGKKYLSHPNTQMEFNIFIPDYEKLKQVAVNIGSKIFFSRVIGLDMCYDYKGDWRVIEVNTKAQSIRFAQYAGIPFFMDYTDEVIQKVIC